MWSGGHSPLSTQNACEAALKELPAAFASSWGFLWWEGKTHFLPCKDQSSGPHQVLMLKTLHVLKTPSTAPQSGQRGDQPLRTRSQGFICDVIPISKVLRTLCQCG